MKYLPTGLSKSNSTAQKATYSRQLRIGKKTGSAACLLVLGILLCTLLPVGSAPGTTFGITSTGSQNYPTATFGTTSAGANVGGVADILVATKYTLSVSGTVTQIGAYASASGNWKLGIYSDNSGAPGTLLAANNNVNPVVAGNNVFNIGPVYLTAGTYWLAILTDQPNREYNIGTGQADYILGYGFSNSLPGSFGTISGTQTNDYVEYAVYVQVEGYAMATQVSLTDNNAALQSVNFYSYTTGNFRVAIYSDNSGPATKLWESPDMAAAANAWNTVQISIGSPAALTLSSGTYWLVWQWNSPNLGPSLVSGSVGSGQYLPMVYGSFPATWSGGTSSSENWSIYATYTVLSPSPENALGSLIAIAACIGAFALFQKRRKPS